MPIDVENEAVITLSDACRLFPPAGVSPATMARWIQRGVRGVKLATFVIGGRRLTSREAVSRFIAAQNVEESVALTPHQRKRQALAAQTELQRAGI